MILPSLYWPLCNNPISRHRGCMTVYNWSPIHCSYDFPGSLPWLFVSALDLSQPKQSISTYSYQLRREIVNIALGSISRWGVKKRVTQIKVVNTKRL